MWWYHSWINSYSTESWQASLSIRQHSDLSDVIQVIRKGRLSSSNHNKVRKAFAEKSVQFLTYLRIKLRVESPLYCLKVGHYSFFVLGSVTFTFLWKNQKLKSTIGAWMHSYPKYLISCFFVGYHILENWIMYKNIFANPYVTHTQYLCEFIYHQETFLAKSKSSSFFVDWSFIEYYVASMTIRFSLYFSERLSQWRSQWRSHK